VYVAVCMNELIPGRQHLKKLRSCLVFIPSLPGEDKLHTTECSNVLFMAKFCGKPHRKVDPRLKTQEICKPVVPSLNSMIESVSRIFRMQFSAPFCWQRNELG